MIVHRDPESSYDWWVKAGGFDSKYILVMSLIKSTFYKNSNTTSNITDRKIRS